MLSPLEIITIISTIISLIYATILLWDRTSDKPKLKIKDIELQKFSDGTPHISVRVENVGRKEAVNCVGFLSISDSSDKRLKVKDFFGNEVDERPMFWVRHPIRSYTVSKTEISTQGDIDGRKIRLKTKAETAETMGIEKSMIYTLAVGDWNVLRLTLPGAGYTPPFTRPGEYAGNIRVSSATTKDSKNFKFRFPEDFKEA